MASDFECDSTMTYDFIFLSYAITKSSCRPFSIQIIIILFAISYEKIGGLSYHIKGLSLTNNSLHIKASPDPPPHQVL